MTHRDPVQELVHIRGLMDRSTRFLSLSGLSGLFAGLVALVGVALADHHLRSTLGSTMDALTYGTEKGRAATEGMMLTLILDAILVLVVALLGASWFTWRRSRHLGLHWWDASAQRLLLSMLVPLSVGGVFCLALFQYDLPGLVPPTTLLFYGLALFSASRFTLDEVRWLGLSELVLGIFGLFWLEAALLFWALGFGVLHLLYGGLMYLRYERTDDRIERI